MEKRAVTAFGADNTNTGASVEDLKLMMVKHVIRQYGCLSNPDVWSILAETKVGARRTAALLEKLRTVFSLT